MRPTSRRIKLLFSTILVLSLLALVMWIANNANTKQDLLTWTLEAAIVQKSKNDEPKLITQGVVDLNDTWNVQREFIKQMMKDAWGDYVRHAWGSNELHPVTHHGSVGGGIFGMTNFGATIIDSLGTLHIMGFNQEFQKARSWIQKHFNFSEINSPVSVFETNIRLLGGFLSAYALTADPLFLDHAVGIGKALLPAFETKSGIPKPIIVPASGYSYSYDGTMSLAASGSLHLEFVYLSSLTNNTTFEDKVEAVRRHHLKKVDKLGLYKNRMDVNTGEYTIRTSSIGATADSFYEYLVKSWIQTGDVFAWKMYENAMNAMINSGMMVSSPTSHLLYFAEKVAGFGLNHVFSHLACFSGGMFALGSSSQSRLYEYKDRDLEIGKNITHTCHESYNRSKTGLGPEVIAMDYNSEAKTKTILGFRSSGYTQYILRPEVVESYFILYRITKDPKYREWGWEAALAIEKWCKVGAGLGYSGIEDVDSDDPVKDDVQPTFFLAETLKYLYLLFSPDDLIDLDYWVFNTEGHPLPIKGKNPMFFLHNPP